MTKSTMMWLHRLKPDDKQRVLEIVSNLSSSRENSFKKEKVSSLQSSLASLYGLTQSHGSKDFIEVIYNQLQYNKYYDKET